MADTTQTNTTYEAATNGHTNGRIEALTAGKTTVECSKAAIERYMAAVAQHGDKSHQHEAITRALDVMSEVLESMDRQPTLEERILKTLKGGK